MNLKVYKYLADYSKDVNDVNRLITSAFIKINCYSIKNNLLLKSLLISKNDKDWLALSKFIELFDVFTFEDIIQLFEFVISPSDKIINGAIYTPLDIRNYIVEQILKKQEGTIHTGLYADISCGCGGFLYTTAKQIKEKTNQSYEDVFSRIYGLDITAYSVERTKILLSLLALKSGEDVLGYEFKIYQGNSLDFDWKERCQMVNQNSGFNAIMGNPPYVCSRNMDKESLDLLSRWTVCTTGHPDLYIPFFQIGFENLAPNGILGYITVNTFFKSINGRGIREYFSGNSINLTIVDFEGEQVFKGRSTYTCLCFIENNFSTGLNYLRKHPNKIKEINTSDYFFIEYSYLDNWNGWNLTDSQYSAETILKIENTGVPFSEAFETRNGIATLKNKIYKFTPVKEDKNFYYRKENGGELVKIEKGICRPIINSNSIKDENSLNENLEKIIFPYRYENNIRTVIPESELLKNFPYTYNYLSEKKTELATRDKGNGNYEAWYAYGRTQSLDIKGFKLFFPHITDSPNFVISKDKDLLFYNGLAAFSDSIDELKILKAVLESEKFWFYISQTSKYYVSGHRSISKNYIKKFGIPIFSDNEKNIIIDGKNKELISHIIESKYKSEEILKLNVI